MQLLQTVTVTINSLRKSLSSCDWISSIFLLSCLDFRNSESKPTSSFRQRLFVFLFLDKLVNGFLQSGKAKDFSFSHYLALFSNFLEIISKPKIAKDLNVLTFWQSCQNKAFNENTKLPKTRLFLVVSLWLVETFYSHMKKPFRFSDWLNNGVNHIQSFTFWLKVIYVKQSYRLLVKVGQYHGN